jgi:hypothetical protein
MPFSSGNTLARVTRLGEFSPIGRVFSLGSFLFYFTERAQTFWATISHGNSNVLISTKHTLGYILGDFFANSSGTDVMSFRIFSPKNLAKKFAFLTQNKAKFRKK